MTNLIKKGVCSKKNKFLCGFKSAFTLAEILIVLGIIGIVAEYTLPSLIANFQKTSYATGAKKAYTIFNQALVRLASDNGCVGDLRCTGLFNGDTNSNNLGTALDDYFRIIKNCGNSTGCFTQPVYVNFDRTGGTTTYDSLTSGYKFITADGMSVFINNDNGGCASISMGRTNHLAQECGYIIVDVNGTQKPNAMGRDVFKFWISNGKGAALYPAGGPDDKAGGADSWWQTTGCGTGGNSGTACAGRLIEQNWQMLY